MRKTLLLILGLAVVVPPVWADDEQAKSAEEKPATPAEQYKAILDEYRKAQTEYSTHYRKVYAEIQKQADTQEEQRKLLTKEMPKIQAKMPKAELFAQRLLALVDKHPGDPVAEDALVWVMTNARTGKEPSQAAEILLRDHVESEKLGAVCQRLVYSMSNSTEDFLRGVLDKSPHREVQGKACLSLAQYLKRQARGKAADEVEQLFERVAKEYADIDGGRRTLGEYAESELFEVRNLAIGKVAPDIEGVDTDGKPMKLSDYRGKVVVLDFWGHW